MGAIQIFMCQKAGQFLGSGRRSSGFRGGMGWSVRGVSGMFFQIVHGLTMLNFLNKLRLTYRRVNPRLLTRGARARLRFACAAIWC